MSSFSLFDASPGSARHQFLRALRAADEGALVLPAAGPAAGSATVLAAVLADAQRRVCVFGGRDGMPRSLGSVLGGAIVRFLGGFRDRGIRVVFRHATSSTSNGIAVSRDGQTLLLSDCSGSYSELTESTYSGYHGCIRAVCVSNGRHLQTIGCSGTGPLQFRHSSQICIAADGCVFVAEASNNRVQVLTPTFGLSGFIGVGQLEYPCGVCTDGDYVAVSEPRLCRVSVFHRRDGALVRRFGSRGSGDGELVSPRGLCCMAACRGHRLVAVVDSGNKRITVFTMAGDFVRHIGAGQLGYPVGVACSGSGDELLVTDICAHSIAVFSASGELLRTLHGFYDDGFTSVAVHRDTIFAKGSYGGVYAM